MAYLLSCLLGLLLLDDTLLLLELRSQHVLLGLLVVHRGVREVHLSRDVEGIRRFPSSSLQAKKGFFAYYPARGTSQQWWSPWNLRRSLLANDAPITDWLEDEASWPVIGRKQVQGAVICPYSREKFNKRDFRPRGRTIDFHSKITLREPYFYEMSWLKRENPPLWENLN